MRRLPVYILIDTSGSMRGEPIESVKVGLETMVSTLRTNPYALETVWLSIITYDREVKQLLPLTALANVQIPEIIVPESGPTHTGLALQYLCEGVDREVRRTTHEQKGDWRPLMFLMTDGKPSDIQLYNEMIPEVKRRHFSEMAAFAAGMNARTEPLRQLTDNTFRLDTADSAAFSQLFKWVSDTVSTRSEQAGREGGSLTFPQTAPETPKQEEKPATDDDTLPPPAEEINIDFPTK